MKIRIILLVCTILLLHSCDKKTPVNYFDTAVLNVNTVSGFGSQELELLVSGKELKNLMGKVDDKFVVQHNAELHVRSWKILDIENKIKSIKELEPTEDTKEMLSRSLELFNFVLEKYKTEYVSIAKLIDAGAPKSEIESKISDFDNKELIKFNAMYEGVIEVGLPYAKANGIEVTY